MRAYEDNAKLPKGAVAFIALAFVAYGAVINAFAVGSFFLTAVTLYCAWGAYATFKGGKQRWSTLVYGVRLMVSVVLGFFAAMNGVFVLLYTGTETVLAENYTRPEFVIFFLVLLVLGSFFLAGHLISNEEKPAWQVMLFWCIVTIIGGLCAYALFQPVDAWQSLIEGLFLVPIKS